MEGGGIFTALGMLLLAPFQWWQRRQQKRRMLSPHEWKLRQASRPVGVLVVGLTVAAALYGVRGTWAALAGIFLDLDRNWPIAALLGVALIWGVSSVIAGARCRGMRDEEMLTVRAFFKLALGAAVTIWLGRFYPWPHATGWAAFVIPAVFLIGLWCAVTGAVRLLLLTIGGGSALRRRAARQAARRNAPMRPGRFEMAKKGVLHLGHAWNPETGRTGKPVTFDISDRISMVIGPTRCGKDATLGIPNHAAAPARLVRHSIWIRPAQSAAVCGEACTRCR